ncbi:hypothetical protein [Aquimarina sp. SS2-1]|uniref:hypothetical protein n=1 Tax=Aquimarina besae TaxID=3342247 RepID=UPI00366B19F6
MAPLKFEDSIKEKLEQRTIQPSNGSWDKLEQQLNNKNSHKKVKSYWWFGVAASITGFLILSTVFITSNEKLQPIELVDTKKEVSKENQSKDRITLKTEKLEAVPSKNLEDKELVKEPVVMAENSDLVPTEIKKRVSKAKSKADVNNNIFFEEHSINNSTTEVVVMQIDTIKEEIVREDQTLKFVDPSIIDSKVAGLIAKVKEIEAGNEVVTDKEVDALLRKAQQEITTERILKSNTVSASTLLLDVEYELDESFKDRVFEALKTGFEKLKTSVAERDN